MLTEQKGLPQNTHRDVWERKQKITLEKLGNLKINSYLVSVFSKLSENYKICSMFKLNQKNCSDSFI